jgi:hypothetical protein
MESHDDPDSLAHRLPWRWTLLVLLGSCLLCGSWFYLMGHCTPSGSDALQALDALPETRLLPPQSTTIARESSDGSCAIESPYHVSIRMTVESELTPVHIRAFYVRAMKEQGWKHSWSDADEIHWYNDERVLAVYFLTAAPERPSGPIAPMQTLYFLDGAEWKRP